MAAVQQRSPTDHSGPPPPEHSRKKDVKFIESMEDEVRRCAEHLERRQSRKTYRSMDRKSSNGYSSSSSGSSKYFERNGAEMGPRSTLPRSFTVTSSKSEAAVVGEVVLSPRVIPPGMPHSASPSSGGGGGGGGRRSPRKSPADRTKARIFKFSSNVNGLDDASSSGVGGTTYLSRHSAIPPDSSPPDRAHTHPHQPNTPRGNSAPPEVYSVFTSSSGTGTVSLTSRDHPPLQSPIERTPKGAISSHSRKSSCSTTSSSSPPPVPPKPAKSRRAKSHTPPSPHRAQISHTVEVDAGRLSTPSIPPVAPLPPAALTDDAATAKKKGQLEFPSADVQEEEGDAFLAKKSVFGTGVVIESSVDAEDYKVTVGQRSAPPTTTTSTTTSTSSSSGRFKVSYTVVPTRSPGENRKLMSKSQDQLSNITIKKSLRGTESSVDLLDDDTSNAIDTADSTADAAVNSNSKGNVSDFTSSDTSLGGHMDCQSVSDPSLNSTPCTSAEPLSSRNSRCVDVQTPCSDTSTTSVTIPVRKKTKKQEVETEVDVEQEVEELLEELADSRELMNTVTVMVSPKPVTPDSTTGGTAVEEATSSAQEEAIAAGGMEGGKERLSTHTGEDTQVSVLGDLSDDDDDEDEEPDILGIPLVSIRSETIVPGESSELEIKSIPLQSRVSSGRRQQRKSSKSTPQESGKEGTSAVDSSLGMSEGEVDPRLEGVSESVLLLVKELQIKLREREEDVARLMRQKEREATERDERIKKLLKETKKVEREKWELLKRARDSAERSLHLRTQLDTKEGALRSAQGELDRTRDELVSVKSANTSLRALLSDLRSNRSKVDIGVQVELRGTTLKRNPSMELAFAQGELSQEQDAFERMEYGRMSSSSLGLHWPERISLDSRSLQDESREMTPVNGFSQPFGSRESHKSSRRKGKGGFFWRRGSKTSITSMGKSCDSHVS